MPDSPFVLYVDARHVSPYAMSVFVALTEKGVPFTTRLIDLRADAHRAPNYLRASLTGRVPMLSHGDFHLSESSAIAEYLEELLPAPGYRALYPQGRQARARARQIQAWLRSDLGALREARPTTAVFGAPLTTPLTDAARDDGERLCAFVESVLPAGATQLFDQWSIADTDLALMLQRLLNSGDAAPSAVATFACAQWQRPSLQAWLALPRPAHL